MCTSSYLNSCSFFIPFTGSSSSLRPLNMAASQSSALPSLSVSAHVSPVSQLHFFLKILFIFWPVSQLSIPSMHWWLANIRVSALSLSPKRLSASSWISNRHVRFHVKKDCVFMPNFQSLRSQCWVILDSFLSPIPTSHSWENSRCFIFKMYPTSGPFFSFPRLPPCPRHATIAFTCITAAHPRFHLPSPLPSLPLPFNNQTDSFMLAHAIPLLKTLRCIPIPRQVKSQSSDGCQGLEWSEPATLLSSSAIPSSLLTTLPTLWSHSSTSTRPPQGLWAWCLPFPEPSRLTYPSAYLRALLQVAYQQSLPE